MRAVSSTPLSCSVVTPPAASAAPPPTSTPSGGGTTLKVPRPGGHVHRAGAVHAGRSPRPQAGEDGLRSRRARGHAGRRGRPGVRRHRERHRGVGQRHPRHAGASNELLIDERSSSPCASTCWARQDHLGMHSRGVHPHRSRSAAGSCNRRCRASSWWRPTPQQPASWPEAQPHRGRHRPERSAEVYQLDTLAPDIEDHPENATRFVVVGRRGIPAPTGHDKTWWRVQRADGQDGCLGILGDRGTQHQPVQARVRDPRRRACGSSSSSSTSRATSTTTRRRLPHDLKSKQTDVKFLGSYPRRAPTAPRCAAGRRMSPGADASITPPRPDRTLTQPTSVPGGRVGRGGRGCAPPRSSHERPPPGCRCGPRPVDRIRAGR